MFVSELGKRFKKSVFRDDKHHVELLGKMLWLMNAFQNLYNQVYFGYSESGFFFYMKKIEKRKLRTRIFSKRQVENKGQIGYSIFRKSWKSGK